MELKFNNGKFRIMQIADTQDTSWTSPDTVNFIRCALEKAKPDLVVFEQLDRIAHTLHEAIRLLELSCPTIPYMTC